MQCLIHHLTQGSQSDCSFLEPHNCGYSKNVFWAMGTENQSNGESAPLDKNSSNRRGTSQEAIHQDSEIRDRDMASN